MDLDFDLHRIATTEFGVGRRGPTGFFFVPTDNIVQRALREMVLDTCDTMAPAARPEARYQPSEKYKSPEYCYLLSHDPMVELFYDLFTASNLPTRSGLPSNLRDLTCYFVRLTDRTGRRLIAVRRATYFKGIARKRLLRFSDDTLELIPDSVFKLDEDFDLVMDANTLHIWRTNSLESLGGLKDRILETVPANVHRIREAIPFVACDPIESYAADRIRAARYLGSIRRHNLDGIDRAALESLCTETGVEFENAEGNLRVSDQHVMAFLEVLDRRRYRVELVREAPELYRAGSRERVGGS